MGLLDSWVKGDASVMSSRQGSMISKEDSQSLLAEGEHAADSVVHKTVGVPR